MPARRSWTALLAALLLLVPLAMRAHVHAGHAERDCAVCVVSHHAPVVHAVAPVATPPITVASTIETPGAAAPAPAERAAHAGRGPPRLLPAALS